MTQQAPPGWYPDAHVAGRERWWDGGQWSQVTRDANPQPPSGFQTPYQPAAPQGGQFRPGLYQRDIYQRNLPQYPIAVETYVSPDGAPLASWGRRAVARFIDFLITWAIVVPLAWSQLGALGNALSAEARRADDIAKAGGEVDPFVLARDPNFQDNFIQVVLFALVVTALYEIIFVAMRGATPGMSLLGIQVRPVGDVTHPGWGSSMLRWLVAFAPVYALGIIGSLFWLIDILFPLWDNRNQAIHDKAAKTVVVRSPRRL